MTDRAPETIRFAMCVALALGMGFAGLSVAERGPSTPGERARAVKIAREHERDPVGDSLEEDRRWLALWLIEVPDIEVRICGAFLGSAMKKKVAEDLILSQLFSTAAFVIENPERAKDPQAAYLAGLEGALRAYEAMLRTKPKSRHEFLDGLLERRGRGELGAYVAQKMADCKEGEEME